MYADALKKLMDSEEDEVLRGQYEWALLDVESRRDPVTLPTDALEELVGGYGPRRITMEDGVLYYQRGDGPRMRLEPMSDTIFRVGDLDYFRLSFERDDAGGIARIVGHYESGRTDSNERDGR